MKKNIIEEAIANIASTSEVLERFCNDPKNYNSAGAEVLERMSWELKEQCHSLREIQYTYGF
jgi:hypothetical protein